MIKRLIFIFLATLPAIAALAVTEKEMEEARVIAAKAYLRYANDGSGYLDDVKATTMNELQAKLKTKEKENLKAFNSVKVPSDFASWDKAKLVEFWSITFFTSPNLTAKGKAARNVVKRRISAMNIAAPAVEKPAEKPKEEKPAASETETSTGGASAETPAPASDVPTAENAIEQQEEILADQNAIADAEAESKNINQKGDNTWIYVVVLIILVGVVIWLVVFAANMMKNQRPYEEEADAPRATTSADDSELRAGFSKAMAKKDIELRDVASRLEKAESDNARIAHTLEKYKNENMALRQEVERLKAENQAIAAKAAQAAAATATAKTAAAPVAEKAPEKKMPNVIYLGRANARGLFVRADRRINPGNTIYRLDTRDGLVGTFHVVDEPEVTDVALANPVEYLAGGCNAIDIEDTEGATRIVTENAGTALFENGCWKVLRKSRIRYE